MQDLSINLLYKNDKEKELIYTDWEKQLENKVIKFLKREEVSGLKELIYKFFYKMLPTYYANSKIHCLPRKRRSLIDFYIIQRYYLDNPLSMSECADIYFNKIGRQIPRYENEIRKANKNYTESMINNLIQMGYTYYYCPTVERQVFKTTNEYIDLHINRDPVEKQYIDFNLNQFDDYKVSIDIENKIEKIVEEKVKTEFEKEKEILTITMPKFVGSFSYKTNKQIFNQSKLVRKVNIYRKILNR